MTHHAYVATEQDFRDAQVLHRRNRRWAAAGFYFWYVLLPVAACALLAYTAFRWIAHGRAAAGLAVAVTCPFVYFALLMQVLRWWQFRRAWAQAQPKKYRGSPVTLGFDEEWVVSARPGESEGRFQWQAIEDYAEDERLALIYVRRKAFLFVPKRAMEESEWARLRALALPRKAKR